MQQTTVSATAEARRALRRSVRRTAARRRVADEEELLRCALKLVCQLNFVGDVRNLCALACTARVTSALVILDSSLWQRLDLTPFTEKLNNMRLCSLVARAAGCLNSLDLTGCVRKGLTNLGLRRALKAECSLQRLRLVNCNFSVAGVAAALGGRRVATLLVTGIKCSASTSKLPTQQRVLLDLERLRSVVSPTGFLDVNMHCSTSPWCGRLCQGESNSVPADEGPDAGRSGDGVAPPPADDDVGGATSCEVCGDFFCALCIDDNMSPCSVDAGGCGRLLCMECQDAGILCSNCYEIICEACAWPPSPSSPSPGCCFCDACEEIFCTKCGWTEGMCSNYCSICEELCCDSCNDALRSFFCEQCDRMFCASCAEDDTQKYCCRCDRFYCKACAAHGTVVLATGGGGSQGAQLWEDDHDFWCCKNCSSMQPYNWLDAGDDGSLQRDASAAAEQM